MSYKLALRKLYKSGYLLAGEIFGARRFYCQNNPYKPKQSIHEYRLIKSNITKDGNTIPPISSLFMYEYLILAGTLCTVGFIYQENTKKYDYTLITSKINKITDGGTIISANISPEYIFALQFKEEKRDLFEKYITYPGRIISYPPTWYFYIWNGNWNYIVRYFNNRCFIWFNICSQEVKYY